MAVLTHLETDTGTNTDISSATAVGAYTANADKLVMVDVSIDAVAGNGDYVMYVTRQIGGSGSAYRILPQTTMPAASGLTAISAQSGWITVRNGDVLTCYVDGLAGDTSTPDWSTRWFELAGVTAAGIADAVLDEATADHTTAGSVGKQLSDAALEATLTAIKGVGWTDETLVKIVTDVAATATAADLATLDGKVDTVDGILDDLHDTDIPAILADTNELQTDLVNGGRLDLLIDSIITHLTDIKGIGWESEQNLINTYARAVGIEVIVQRIMGGYDYTLWTDESMITLQAAINAVKAKSDQLAFTVANQVDANALTGGGAGGGATAAEVWSHAARTLTVPAVATSDPNDPTILELYRDADINIEFTGLTIPTGAKKVVFTIKDNLDDADTASVLQATYQVTAFPAETHTLNYINSAVPPTLTTPVTFTVDTDSVEFDMTAAAAYLLPRYERGYLNWDLKLITATSVQILQQGLVQILGTSTRTVA